MPKIYAKHNLIPCGFISAKKPVGGSRGQIPPRMCPTCLGGSSSEPAAPGGAFMLELPQDPVEGLTASTAGSSLVYVPCTKGSVLPRIILVRDTHGSETGRGVSDKAGGGSITLTRLLAGWLLFGGSCSFPAVRPLSGLSTLPWELWGRQVKDIGQDWVTFLKEGRGIFSPWAKGSRAGRRNRLAPYVV